MGFRSVGIFVTAAVTLSLTQLPAPAPQTFQSIGDEDAYAVYAAVVPATWSRVSKDTLLLQRETEGVEAVAACLFATPALEPEWQAAENSFKEENARVRLLQPHLPIAIPYRLIPRSEIDADDARLARKYPGSWQRRPESMEYAAVSAVGFDSTRTMAIVYVRLRSSGNIHYLERRDAAWVPAQRARGCGGWHA